MFSLNSIQLLMLEISDFNWFWILNNLFNSILKSFLVFWFFSSISFFFWLLFTINVFTSFKKFCVLKLEKTLISWSSKVSIIVL
ncbi:hypothetical protein DR103_00135 [Mycoplasma hyorhinis]|uniref:Uncharacterized protein n=1 Tax=Mesomycoplasma hyorhinis (strain MCLD) TaxID=936139 RepID=A0ABM5M6F1_MESHM|nr:hypothetical protein SRH_02270 [Mesomycoplasma hyorhinis MCLD]MXR07668.1 hypothetical protein [Mesomycoplasma hyorhinis]